MKFFCAIVLLLTAIVFAAAGDLEDELNWQSYKAKFQKKHHSKDEARRKANFIKRQRQIEKHNKENKEWEMGNNQFSDMTDEERRAILGAKPDIRKERSFNPGYPIEDRALPISIDYRSDKCMQPVKDQASCGSCWSFATVVPLEFNTCKKTGTPVALSEQMLVDCDPYNHGCNGGDYTQAWQFIKEKGGIMINSSYPYVSGATQTKGTCKFSSSSIAARVSSYGWTMPYPNATVSMQYLQSNGPLPSAMRVLDSLYQYKTGVYSDSACILTDENLVDHAVVIVGYGTTTTTPAIPYWIVRNSWGTTWGNQGYMAIKRGVNMCNIESWTAYVDVL
ncbi:uncharacterized protein LOC130702116 [Daphnia carinata]|uniref:uncharacterized protein LOC130702116 n=1 Tax=Daphnia carinata TaxID=120202 RepID=UPI00257CB3A9|nr:uncharacterized protein LOC130702116 [Daphnia carinata]